MGKVCQFIAVAVCHPLKDKKQLPLSIPFCRCVREGVFTSNADNAVYKYAAAAPNEAPYYRATVTANRRDFALSKPFIDLLKGENNQLPVADPRLSKYASVNNLGVYEGLAYGLTEAQAGSFAAGDVSLPEVSTAPLIMERCY